MFGLSFEDTSFYSLCSHVETRTPAVKRATSLVLNLTPLIKHDSAEEVKCSDNLQEKENATQLYIPQNDEKYNVALKTWCMVTVCISRSKVYGSGKLADSCRFWLCPTVSRSGSSHLSAPSRQRLRPGSVIQLQWPYISICTIISPILCPFNGANFHR